MNISTEIDRSYSMGYQAAEQGWPVEANPFKSPDWCWQMREAWVRGHNNYHSTPASQAS
jgi:hypothetical protein